MKLLHRVAALFGRRADREAAREQARLDWIYEVNTGRCYECGATVDHDPMGMDPICPTCLTDYMARGDA